MSRIHEVHARLIFDSRGDPAVEAEVVLHSGIVGSASFPAADRVSAGDVHAVLNGIAPELEGLDVIDQMELDRLMREAAGTVDHSTLLAVSAACARAAAEFLELPLFRYLGGVRSCVLPVPFYKLFSLPETGLYFVPDGAGSFRNAFRMVLDMQKLRRETALEPETADEALSAAQEWMKKAGITPDKDARLILFDPGQMEDGPSPAGVKIDPVKCKTISGVLAAAEKIHRSGNRTLVCDTAGTGDDLSADLAVAVNAAGIGIGAEMDVTVGNRLMRLEEMLGDIAEFGA